MPDRVLILQGIHNFRDYGGYAARGGRLRRGVLWRSGQHGHATADDLAQVHELSLQTVIDLRGDSERAANPCLRHQNFAGEVLFYPGETASQRGRAVHEEAARGAQTADDARNAMLRLYDQLAFRKVLVGTMQLYFQTLEKRETPSLLHCVAGKDRTGVTVAILHSLLGVHRDDIYHDFLLTNTAGDSEARIAAGIRHLRSGFGRNMDDAALRVVMSVEPAFLDRMFKALIERHGSVEDYARDVLGVTPQMLAGLEQQLIES